MIHLYSLAENDTLTINSPTRLPLSSCCSMCLWIEEWSCSSDAHHPFIVVVCLQTNFHIDIIPSLIEGTLPSLGTLIKTDKIWLFISNTSADTKRKKQSKTDTKLLWQKFYKPQTGKKLIISTSILHCPPVVNLLHCSSIMQLRLYVMTTVPVVSREHQLVSILKHFTLFTLTPQPASCCQWEIMN